jgi:hypothetical protein
MCAILSILSLTLTKVRTSEDCYNLDMKLIVGKSLVKYGSSSGFSAPRGFNRSIACMNENYHALTGVWREPE